MGVGILKKVFVFSVLSSLIWIFCVLVSSVLFCEESALPVPVVSPYQQQLGQTSLTISATLLVAQAASNSVTTKMPPFRAVMDLNEGENKSVGNIALLPLRQTTKGSDRGPAPTTKGEDIVDQSLNLFKVRNRNRLSISQTLFWPQIGILCSFLKSV